MSNLQKKKKKLNKNYCFFKRSGTAPANFNFEALLIRKGILKKINNLKPKCSIENKVSDWLEMICFLID